MRLLSLISLILLSFNLYAGGNQELLKFFEKIGAHGASNVTESGAYYSQLGGGWNGGSLSYRTPIEEQRMGLNIDMPSVGGGCGGVDLHLGGISFVNGSGFRNMFDAVKANAVEITTTSLIKALTGSDVGQQILSYVKMAQDAASTSMNSCRMAQLAVDSVTDAARTQMQKVCVNNKGDSSFLEAMKICSNQNGKELGKQSKFFNYNVTWEAIGNGSMLKAEDQWTRQSVLSLLGTVIIRDGVPKTYYPLSSSCQALLNGGVADTYSCVPSSGCLTMVAGKTPHSYESSLSGKIHESLQSINEKIILDQKLGDFEIGVIETTKLPILKLLTVYSAYTQGRTLDIPKEYSEVIAIGILRTFVQAVIDESRIVAQTIDVTKDVADEVKSLADKSENVLKGVLKDEQSMNKVAEEIEDKTKIIETKLLEHWAKQIKV